MDEKLASYIAILDRYHLVIDRRIKLHSLLELMLDVDKKNYNLEKIWGVFAGLAFKGYTFSVVVTETSDLAYVLLDLKQEVVKKIALLFAVIKSVDGVNREDLVFAVNNLVKLAT